MSRPSHVTLAVVLQVQGGPAAGAALAAGSGAVRGVLVAARRVARAGRDARDVHPQAPCGKGRRAGALAPRAARDAKRSRPIPRRVGARHCVPRPGSERRRPCASHRHELARGRIVPRAGVRPSGDRARGSRSATGEAVLHEHRLRARTGGVHHLRAPRPLFGGARPRGVGHEPAADPRPPPAPRADRSPPRARAAPADVPPRSSASACGGSR